MQIESKINKVTSTLETTSQDMTIDAEGMTHIIGILTDLYEDPEKTVIREYYSNAVDSHIASGTDRKIEVKLPDYFDPTFVVQDYGVGMSEHEVLSIYSSYGKSTKRHTNDQIGAFGLGCKSALSYTTQFSVESVKDGQKTLALIARKEDGGSEVNIISTSETTESNGVRISIPVAEYNSFNAKAKEHFKYVDHSQLILETEEYIENFRKDAMQIGDIGWIEVSKNSYYTRGSSQLLVLMGGVAYPVSNSQMKKIIENTGVSYIDGTVVTIECPIGTVDLTPSRESLRETERTVEYVTDRFEKLADKIKEELQKSVDASENIIKARINATKLAVYYGLVEYRGYYYSSNELLTALTFDSKPLDTGGDSDPWCTALLKYNETYDSEIRNLISGFKKYLSGDVETLLEKKYLIVKSEVQYTTFKRWVDRASETSAYLDYASGNMHMIHPESELTDEAQLFDMTIVDYDEFKTTILKAEKAKRGNAPKPVKVAVPRSFSMTKTSVFLVEGETCTVVNLLDLEGEYYITRTEIARRNSREYFNSDGVCDDPKKIPTRHNLFIEMVIDGHIDGPALIVPSWVHMSQLDHKIKTIDLGESQYKGVEIALKKYTRSTKKRALIMEVAKTGRDYLSFTSDFFLNSKFNDPIMVDAQKKMKTLTKDDLEVVDIIMRSLYRWGSDDTFLDQLNGHIDRNYSFLSAPIRRSNSYNTEGLADMMRIMYTKNVKPKLTKENS